MERERKMDSAEMERDGYKPRDVLNWRKNFPPKMKSIHLSHTHTSHALSVSLVQKILRTNGGDGVDVMTLTPHQ